MSVQTGSAIVGLVMTLTAQSMSWAGEAECGPLENAYGPFDYTNPRHKAEKLPVVENAHFNDDVENLRRAVRHKGDPISDIDYTLRAFPNHHRALDAVARYRLKKPWRVGMQYRSADCYFDRAIRFKRDDGVVYLVYGIYLHRKKDYEGAEERYEQALKILPRSAEAHYNLGLLKVEKEDFDEARYHAEMAYRLGYPLPGLKERLMKLGAWESKKPGP